MIFTGIYFDGRVAVAHPIHLIIKHRAIHLLGQGIDLLIPIGQIRLNEPFAYAPGILELGNGAHCEFHENKRNLQKALHYRASWVERWQARWQAALLAVVFMLGLLFAAYHWGIPKLTAMVVVKIPPSVETKIGAEMIPVLDKSLFTPSKLTDAQKQNVRDIFDSIKPAHPRLPMQLIFRASPQLGPNAIALPGGTIAITDQMVTSLADKSGALNADSTKELAGVFAHEIGHVELRHTLRSLLSNSAVTVLAATLFGDFSALVTAVPVILVGSEYSREMEAEADGYAIQLLEEHDISPDYMAKVFEQLHKSSEKNAFNKMPRWIRFTTDFTASHPSDEERIKRFHAAAAQSPVKPVAPANP